MAKGHSTDLNFENKFTNILEHFNEDLRIITAKVVLLYYLRQKHASHDQFSVKPRKLFSFMCRLTSEFVSFHILGMKFL